MSRDEVLSVLDADMSLNASIHNKSRKKLAEQLRYSSYRYYTFTLIPCSRQTVSLHQFFMEACRH